MQSEVGEGVGGDSKAKVAQNSLKDVKWPQRSKYPNMYLRLDIITNLKK